jgi:hypothetical protein
MSKGGEFSFPFPPPPWPFLLLVPYTRTARGENAMRRGIIFVFTITFVFGLAEWGIAGPFGLTMGMQPAEVGEKLEKTQSPGIYHTTEVPKPHSSINSNAERGSTLRENLEMVEIRATTLTNEIEKGYLTVIYHFKHIPLQAFAGMSKELKASEDDAL